MRGCLILIGLKIDDLELFIIKYIFLMAIAYSFSEDIQL